MARKNPENRSVSGREHVLRFGVGPLRGDRLGEASADQEETNNGRHLFRKRN
jgi:hypothetical protein